MKQEVKEMVAGVVMILLFAGLLLFVHVRSVDKGGAGLFTLQARFLKADGLMNGSTVRLAGVPVGRVAEQRLDNDYGVIVTMAFDKKMALSVDSSVTIETDGLFGEKHLEIAPGGDDRMLKSGDMVEYAQGALLIDELLERMNDMARAKNGKDEKDEKKSD